ncbi:MAG: DNA primase [Calditrichaeota bacterium]|nr:DNA primase [Calditrichota bacterium]
MAVIPDHIIERVRDAVDIVEVIRRYVHLKKSGRNYMGLCPFHKEKTPSFSVSPEKQIFHCFGCGVGGNVFSFLMKYENIGFVDAVKRLAAEAGIEIPTSPEVKRKVSQAEQLYKANQIAAAFYQRQLEQAPPSVKSYLEKRGLLPETIAHFKLGFAPDAWDALLKHVEHFKYSLQPFQKVGLFVQSERRNSWYDRFRNRLIFPIHNTSGQVVGFGARAMADDPSTPKYINSPESPIYQKSKILYGLYFAREAIRAQGQVIVVEGYMDLLQLFQAGIQNVVATSGTALTEEHARLIRRYTQKVYLCYDADTAGIQAAARGGEALFQHNLDVYVLLLPAGEDPDSFVRQQGKGAFLDLLKTAREYFDFRLGELEQRYDLQQASQRSQAINEILDTLANIRDNLRMGFYVDKIAERWQLPSTLLFNELQKRIKTRQRREQFRERVTPPADSPSPPEAPQTQTQPLMFTGAWSAERDVIVLLANYFSEIQDFIFEQLTEEDFLNPEFRDLFVWIREHGQEAGEHLHLQLLDRIASESLRNMLAEALFQEFQKPGRYLMDCIRRIKIARFQAHFEVIRRQLKDLPRTDERYPSLQEKMRQYLQELHQWQTMKFEEQ